MRLGKWADFSGLTMKQVKKHMLVKGVAMSEGTTKRGEIFTRDNLKGAVGGLRAAAKLKKTKLNINHNKNTNVGELLDSELVVNHIDDKELGQVEFIASIKDKEAYRKINNQEINACSVEDSPRVCHSTQCTYEGSTFLNLALVTSDQSPNSLHTWIEPITEDDLGLINHTIVNHLEGETETIEKPIRVSGDLKKTESETESKEDDKEDDVPDDPLDKLYGKIQGSIDAMSEKFDAKLQELKQDQQITAHNHTQMEINDLESQIKNKGFALTTQQHNEYWHLKNKLDDLKKKSNMIKN